MRAHVVISLTLVAAATAARADDVTASAANVTAPPPAPPVLRTAHKESIGLPVRPAFVVDALARTITFSGTGAESAAARVVERSEICRERDATAPARVRCRSAKLGARWASAQSNHLEIEETLGAPLTADDSAVPVAHDDPVALELGAACPGDTAAAQAACALQDGALRRAEAHLVDAMSGPHRDYAALRLGDLDAARGRYDEAARYWRVAGRAGPFARLAALRLCELDGTCFDPRHPRGYDVTTAVALPGPLADEVDLRVARALMFEGRVDDALVRLLGQGRGTQATNLCAQGPALCNRLALHALVEARAGRASAAQALALFHALPDRNAGPRVVDVHAAAAAVAAALGAPAYGGAALAAVAGRVSADALPAHLGDTARLFLDGGDIARAEVVLAFAEESYGGTPAFDAHFATQKARLSTTRAPPVKAPEVSRAEALLATLRAKTEAR